MIEQTMNVDRMEHIISVFGSFDENLHLIESEMNVRISDRDSELKIAGDGEAVMLAQHVIEGLLALADSEGNGA